MSPHHSVETYPLSRRGLQALARLLLLSVSAFGVPFMDVPLVSL